LTHVTQLPVLKYDVHQVITLSFLEDIAAQNVYLTQTATLQYCQTVAGELDQLALNTAFLFLETAATSANQLIALL